MLLECTQPGVDGSQTAAQHGDGGDGGDKSNGSTFSSALFVLSKPNRMRVALASGQLGL